MTKQVLLRDAYVTKCYNKKMLTNKKGQTYDDFRSSQIWSIVDIQPQYYNTRSKLPDALIEKRRAHIMKMYEEGTPMAWIAKLYEYTRNHIYRIIHNIPNN